MAAFKPLTSAIMSQPVSRVLDSFKRDKILERDFESQVNILVHNVGLIERYRDAMVLGHEDARKWYIDLKNIAYAAMDALEAYDTIVDDNKDSKVSCWIEKSKNILYTVSIHLVDVECKVQLARTIELINQSIDKLLKVGEQCGYQKIIESKREEYPKQRAVQAAIPSDNYPILGRDKIKDGMVEKLGADNKGLRVQPIVGMGGIGKTTLAQSVYNSDTVKGSFDSRGWVFVSSSTFDCKSILGEISSVFARKSPDSSSSVSTLMGLLADVVRDIKFLLVMDDVWNKDKNRWEEVLSPLKRGKRGSKLIITTRSRDVVKAIATCHKGGVEPAVIVEGLGDDDMWAILVDHAFGEDKTELSGTLEGIGKQIVEKLQGLPLAAKAIGRVLGNDYSEWHWTKIRDSKLWDKMKSEEDESLIPALILSFLYLPPEAKPCFTYLSLFRKGEYMNERQLVYQWLAHDYLSEKDGKDMEDVREEILNVFQNMSLATRRREEWDGGTYIHIHDLIHDMSAASGRDDHLLVMDARELDENLAEKSIRHLHVYDAKYLNKETAEKVGSCKTLRTLRLGSGGYGDNLHKLEASILRKWFKQLQCLRVLVLRNLKVNEKLPEEIGELKHLRYLDLSFCRIKRLPNALAKLRHLQVLLLRVTRGACYWTAEEMEILGQLSGLRYLDLSNSNMTALPESITALSNLRVLSLKDCYGLRKLPDGIDNLKRLECLDLEGCRNLKKLPPGWGSLSRLRESYTAISEWDAREICGPANFNVTSYTLTIRNLDALQPKAQAQIATMVQKNTELEDLRLEWNPINGNDTRDANNEEEVLECVKPHEYLKALAIYNCTGTKLPSWLARPHLCRLEYLELSGLLISQWWVVGTHSVDQPFLPCLRQLIIRNCPRLQSFPYLRRLKSLELSGLQISQWWVVGTHLRKLIIRNCPRLQSFPYLRRLEWLHLSGLQISQWVGPDNVDEPFLPCLRQLIIRNCPRLQNFPNLPPCLESMELDDVGWSKLPSLQCSGITSLSSSSAYLHSVAIQNCQLLLSLSGGVLESRPPHLYRLTVINCGNLLHFPGNGFRDCKSLKSVELKNCPNLSMQSGVGLPPSLPYLKITDCGSLETESLRKYLETLSSLRKLTLTNCCSHLSNPFLEAAMAALLITTEPSQFSFHDDRLHVQIEKSSGELTVNCHWEYEECKLNDNYSCEESLMHILDYLRDRPSPSRITKLFLCGAHGQIDGYDRILSNPWPHLHKLKISNFVNLNIPLERGSTTFPALESLTLENCKNLRCLPPELSRLSSLKKLAILSCDNFSHHDGGYHI